MTRASDWDPIGTANLLDPVAEHRRMRQTCPVAYTEQFGGFWTVFKHADILAVANDDESFSAAPRFMVPQMDDMMAWLPVQSDPPLHTTYRTVIGPFFKGSRLAAFEPSLRAAANECIDRFVDVGRADLATDLNIRVSASGLCLLMGLPAEYWTNFFRWHVASMEAGVNGDMAAAAAVFADMHAHADDLIVASRAEPGDDLISTLLNAEVDGRRFTEEEVRGTFFLLAVGGFETTADVLNAAMIYLSSRPQESQRLREDPKLMTKAVGEFIRVFAPVQGTVRTALREVTIGDREIVKGETVLMAWSSGSHDEDVFADPDSCVFDRDSHKLTSFGAGIHKCVGEPLARIEIRAVLDEFLRRIDTFELDGEPTRSLWPSLGYQHVPMRFTVRD